MIVNIWFFTSKKTKKDRFLQRFNLQCAIENKTFFVKIFIIFLGSFILVPQALPRPKKNLWAIDVNQLLQWLEKNVNTSKTKPLQSSPRDTQKKICKNHGAIMEQSKSKLCYLYIDTKLLLC